MHKSLSEKAENFARKVLSDYSEDFQYHDLNHTINVVSAAKRIASESGVHGEDLENLVVAAWFHDLGYQEDGKNHEEESVRILHEKLKEWKISEARAREIERLIYATRMPHKPNDLLTRIICDADLSHLGQPDFQRQSEKLRKEINCVFCKDIQPAEWIRMNLEFLRKHNYFTEYGKRVLGPLKNKTLTRISRRVSGS